MKITYAALVVAGLAAAGCSKTDEPVKTTPVTPPVTTPVTPPAGAPVTPVVPAADAPK